MTRQDEPSIWVKNNPAFDRVYVIIVLPFTVVSTYVNIFIG